MTVAVPQTNYANAAGVSGTQYDGSYIAPSVNRQFPAASMLNNQMQPNLPNTVMTTQVQQNLPLQQGPLLHQNASPHHQNMMPNAMAAINQPVSTTILPQNDLRSNIPIYQQQR